MFYRVKKPFKYKDVHGRVREAKPGTAVDIVLERESTKLFAAGRIGPMDLPPLVGNAKPLEPAPASHKTLRVGLFLYTSPHYSGGRIHLFQYAHAFSANGGEVFYCSNTVPKWRGDYPNNGIRYIIWGQQTPPDDLDIIMTDGKSAAADHALDYKSRHPSCKLCVINFETPNWVAEFLPKLAKKVSAPNKSLMVNADLLVANSRESARFLRKWLPKEKEIAILPPAVNTYAVKKQQPFAELADRPYVVWSGRGQDYKGHQDVAKAIWSLPQPCDLVSFGNAKEKPKANAKHMFHSMSQRPDAEKFALMQRAHLTVAPSLFEGFGMVPAESLAVGTPVVAYDLPVLREEYGDAPGLHLVPWNDQKAFAAKVRELLAKPKQTIDPMPIRKKLGMAAMGRRVECLSFHALKTPRVTAQMIAYWGFIPEVLEAVYTHVHEILIAFGPDKNASRVEDGSLERIRAFPDPEGKIKLEVREQWDDKRDMRQWCHENSTGNYNLVLDGDEIWVGLDEWIKSGVNQGCPRWVTLWHDAEHHVVGYPQWGKIRWGREMKPFGCECNHYRWSWLRPSYQWVYHCRIAARDKQALRNLGGASKVPGCQIYHLGHVLPKQVMEAKHKFYRRRDGDDANRKKRQAAWHEWDGKCGDCGDGIVKAVNWKLPDIVRRGVESAQKIEVRA
jgi:glycosyltransferase involved in cell wall biosynthesis